MEETEIDPDNLRTLFPEFFVDTEEAGLAGDIADDSSD